MDLIGLVNSITAAAFNIDTGRKGFAIKGKIDDGRLSYETGISEAMSTFQEAQATLSPKAIIVAEYTFLTQELELCHESDKYSIASLTKAIQSFDDAFLALQAVEEPGYITADKTYPHSGDYRINGFPKDAFHIACISHKTRINNILRSPGIDPIEKELLQQRLVNLLTGQSGYVEMQRKAFEN